MVQVSTGLFYSLASCFVDQITLEGSSNSTTMQYPYLVWFITIIRNFTLLNIHLYSYVLLFMRCYF